MENKGSGVIGSGVREEKKGQGFKGLTVWQKSYELGLKIYRLTKTFPKEEQYGLVSQIRRAILSVPANIAEGYERRYRKEYIQFLMVAKGSLGEVETYLSFSKDLGYINDEVYQELESKRQQVAKLLRGLIKSLFPKILNSQSLDPKTPDPMTLDPDPTTLDPKTLS